MTFWDSIRIFLAHKSSLSDLLVLILVVSVLVPVILIAGVAGVHRLHVRAGKWCQRCLTVLLVSCMAMPAATRGGGLEPALGMGLAFGLGGLMALAVERFQAAGYFSSPRSGRFDFSALLFLLHAGEPGPGRGLAGNSHRGRVY